MCDIFAQRHRKKVQDCRGTNLDKWAEPSRISKMIKTNSNHLLSKSKKNEPRVTNNAPFLNKLMKILSFSQRFYLLVLGSKTEIHFFFPD